MVPESPAQLFSILLLLVPIPGLPASVSAFRRENTALCSLALLLNFGIMSLLFHINHHISFKDQAIVNSINKRQNHFPKFYPNCYEVEI